MVNEIFNWITVALNKEFGSGYKYYIENVEQNLKKPCFAIAALNPMITSRSPKLYRRVVPIVIHYFTDKQDTTDAKKDCYNIAERLWDKLEYLTSYSDKTITIRGEDISWEMVEDVLEFFITYTFDVIREDDEQIKLEEALFNGVPIP